MRAAVWWQAAVIWLVCVRVCVLLDGGQAGVVEGGVGGRAEREGFATKETRLASLAHKTSRRFLLATLPTTMRLLPALAVLTATAVTVNAAVVNAPAAITVEGRACRGLEIGGLGSKFGYDLRLTSFEAGPFCSRSMVK